MKRLVSSLIPGALLVFIMIFSMCTQKNQEGEFISGAKRKGQREKEYVTGTARIVYTVPSMDNVQVKVDTDYGDGKKMDIYYPPGFDFSRPLPVVVFVNGLAGIRAKNMARYIDWGLISAANGMIAVTYDPVYPDKDLSNVLEHIVDKSEELGIDKNKIGLFSYCGTCYMGLNAMEMKNSSFYNSIQMGVFLYGEMPWSDDLNPNTSILMVKTGKKLEQEVIDSIDAFDARARQNGLNTEILFHETGYKYFDITEFIHQPWEYGIDQRFTADCDAIKDIIRFMQKSLSIEPLII